MRSSARPAEGQRLAVVDYPQVAPECFPRSWALALFVAVETVGPRFYQKGVHGGLEAFALQCAGRLRNNGNHNHPGFKDLDCPES